MCSFHVDDLTSLTDCLPLPKNNISMSTHLTLTGDRDKHSCNYKLFVVVLHRHRGLLFVYFQWLTISKSRTNFWSFENFFLSFDPVQILTFNLQVFLLLHCVLYSKPKVFVCSF